MQIFIEEYTSVSFILTVLLQQIFWHSPFKPSYLARPIIEEYLLVFPSFRKMGGGELTDGSIPPVECEPMEQWNDGHRSDKDFVIIDQYYRSKGKNL